MIALLIQVAQQVPNVIYTFHTEHIRRAITSFKLLLCKRIIIFFFFFKCEICMSDSVQIQKAFQKCTVII